MTSPAPTPGPESAGFFFVAGAHKSGTTWVQRMLHSHPQLAVVGEAGFVGFEKGVDSWFNVEAFQEWSTGTRKNAWLRGLSEEEAARAIKRGMISGLMLKRLWQPGVLHVGDKTPHFYNHYAEELHALFPDARVIDVIRDGRDVAVSHTFHMLRKQYGHGVGPEADVARGYHLEGVGNPCPLFFGDSLGGCTWKWKVAVEGSKRARELYGDAYSMVRYEDLLAEPHREVERIFVHLGVRHSDYIVNHCVEQHVFEKAAGRQRGETDNTSFFRKGVAGDWKNYFSEENKAQFKRRAGHLLIEMGYEENEGW